MVDRLRRAGCVYAEDEARLVLETAAGDPAALEGLLVRRCAGEPLELVLGFAEFAGCRVAVTPGVFVPRQRTAGLVDLAESLLAGTDRPVVVDLGCGTGALLMALLHRRRAEGYAIDTSSAAIECAARNLTPAGATVLLGSGLATLPPHLRGRVEVVLANLPYVPTAGIDLMPREARLYEPRSALDGGPDGLGPLRAALAEAADWMTPGGSYLCELHTSQLAGAERYAAGLGYRLGAALDPEDSTALVTVARAG